MTTKAEVRERQRLEDSVLLALKVGEGARGQGAAGGLSKLEKARRQIFP